MHEDINILSYNIRFLRKLFQISQENLAKQLDISRSNIAAYETKNVEPRLKTLLKIARFFDINLRTLLVTKLSENENYPPFEVEPEDKYAIKQFNLDLRNRKVESFVKQTEKIKNVVEGFKIFYNYKKANISNNVQRIENITFEIDNFIRLTEHMLTYNERIAHELLDKQ